MTYEIVEDLKLIKQSDKNWGITFESEDKDKISQFKSFCRENLGDNWFHQGDCETWQFFEYWGNNDELVLDKSIIIADLMKMPLNGPIIIN